MLYIMSIAKLLLPLLTVPYLTRVFTEETYGIFTYVRTVMVYMQLLIDFGFILSSVKDIVNAKGDKEKIGLIAGHTFLAKTVLVGLAFVATLVLSLFIPILRNNLFYTLLCFIGVATTAYMGDFLFRGVEKMHIITIIFVVMKSISTLFTFILIRGDGDLFMIPVLDIAAHIVAVVMGFVFIGRLGIKVKINSIKTSLKMMLDSFTYFVSDMASSIIASLTTIVIGIVITDLKEIAYWGVCMQLVSVVQGGFYGPVINGIYPYMIKKKSLKFIHRVLMIFMPIVAVGCLLCFLLSDVALGLVGGADYIVASPVFKALIPVLFLSFPAQLYGWPAMGSVGLVKETSTSTIIAAGVQILGLAVLVITNQMNLINLALLRCVVEFSLLAVRLFATYKNKNRFVSE